MVSPGFGCLDWAARSIGWGELANPNIHGRHDAMEYRRIRQEGGTYFFTVNLADRSSMLLVDRVDDLRRAVRVVKRRHSFDIVAWVVLPDHMHAIWTLPPGDGDCATCWMLIKAGFSRSIPKHERIRASRKRKGERGIWQRRFWEHAISRPISTTCTSIQSSMAMRSAHRTGRTARSIATSGLAGWPWIGRQRQARVSARASDEGVGPRSVRSNPRASCKHAASRL